VLQRKTLEEKINKNETISRFIFSSEFSITKKCFVIFSYLLQKAFQYKAVVVLIAMI
jgi:hypothetical protein